MTGGLTLQYANPRIVLKDAEGTTLGAFGLNNNILSYYKTADTKWYTIYHSGNFTPSNYLPLTGGTISGTLTLTKDTNTILVINGTKGTPAVLFQYNGTNLGRIFAEKNDGGLYRTDATWSKQYKIWDEGNDGSGSGLDADLLDGIHARQFTRTVHVANTANSYVKILRFTRTNDKGWLRLSVNESNSNKTGASGEFIIEWGFIESTTSTRDLAISCLYSRFDIAKNLTAVRVDFDTFDLYWTTSAWCRTAFTLIDYAQTCTIDDFTPTALNELPTATYTSSLSGSMYINASSAIKLQTARTIWGQSFDGTGNISGNVIIDNNRGVNIKDTGGTSRTALFISDSNNLHLGYGQSVAGYNTYIDGKNIYLRYGTSNTTGMVLNSSGNITIGSSDLASTNYKLYVNDGLYASGSINSPILKTTGGYGLYQGNYYNDSLVASDVAINGNNIILAPSSCVGVGLMNPSAKLHVAGDILATGAINQESQRDLKNIIDEKVLSLDDMNTINPTRFTWKDNRDEDIHYGGIAEDIQQVIPEVVHKSGDNLTVEYANAAFAMVTSLVKHVKDLEQRLSKLEEDYKQLLLNNKQ